MKSLISLSKSVISTGAALALSLYVSAAHAIGDVPSIGGGPEDLRAGILEVLTYILGFLGLIAVIVIVIAGIRLIIGGADEGQREKARNAVLYAVIGLILVLLASAIVNFVAGTFG
jgi:type IV secretory pathway VirB2 component (pilin)